jgi:radical SAM protein with 4Fe4S-binding SPASM domain
MKKINQRIREFYRNLDVHIPKVFLGHIYKKMIRNADRPPLPHYLEIEPTTRCNLNCVMCFRNSFIKNKTMKIGDMSFETFKKILDKLPFVEEIDIQGMGEPFLNKDFLKMVKYAKSKGIKTMTVTNATLIGHMAEDIVESGLDLIRISFYSTKPEIYEKIMRNSKMDKVIENIKKLNEVKKIKNSETPIIEIALAVMHDNMEDVVNFPELAKELGAKKIILGEIYGYKKPFLADNEKIKKLLKEFEKKCKNLNLKFSIDVPKKVYTYDKICLWPWVGTYITWEGEIKPCCTRPYYTDFSFGNILKENFEDIWYSDKYIEFRKSLKSKNIPFICKGCPFDFSVFDDKIKNELER